MRGYGQTDAPEAIDQYTLLHLVGDMVGLLDALGAATAVIVGPRLGRAGRLARRAAAARTASAPSIGLSVPFRPRGADAPDQRHAADRRARSSTSSTSRSPAWPRRSCERDPRRHDPRDPLLGLGRGARRRRPARSPRRASAWCRAHGGFLAGHARARARCRPGSPRPTSTSTPASSRAPASAAG